MIYCLHNESALISLKFQTRENEYMNTLVCDDDLIISNRISKYIKDKFGHNVVTVTNRDAALEIIHSISIDLLIIDIVLKNDNGILLAEKIQKIQPDIKVIFITGYGSVYYDDIFENIAPQGFLEKPIQYNILNFFIKQIEGEYKKKSTKLKISYDFKEYLIPIDKILYIQSTKRVCEIITENETFRCYKKLSGFLEELPDFFIRCHQSYIVNINYVKSHEIGQFTLTNGMIVPISKSYAKNAKNLYLMNFGG